MMPVVLAVFIMFLSCFRISKKSRCRAVSSVYKFISFIYTRPALVLLILHTQKPHPPDETTGYMLLVEMALANSQLNRLTIKHKVKRLRGGMI